MASSLIQHYVQLLRYWAWLFVLLGVLGSSAAYLYNVRQPRVYQSSTTMLIDEGPGSRATADYQSILTSERRAQTYVELLTATPLLDQVASQLALPYKGASLKNQLTVRRVRDTQLITIDVRDTDAVRAAEIANTLVAAFGAERQAVQSRRYTEIKATLQTQIKDVETNINETSVALAAVQGQPGKDADQTRLESALAQYRQSYQTLLQTYNSALLNEAQSAPTITQTEPAVAPSIHISPRVRSGTLLGGVFGLALAAGLVLLREQLDDTIKHQEQLAASGVPVLGLIGRMDRGARLGPIVNSQPRTPIAEAFRTLRTNLQFASVDRPLRTLLITSPSSSEGKSTVSCNIVAVLAQSGNTVIAVDADMRRPRLNELFQAPNRNGLAELFVQSEIEQVLHETTVKGVSLITAGTLPPNPAELLGSDRMRLVLDELTKRSNIVVLDAPPVNPVTDAAVLAGRVDGVVLVVRSGTTKLAAYNHAVEQLRRGNAHLLGVVINDIPRRGTSYGYYQGYGDRSYGERNGNWLTNLFRRKDKARVEDRA